MLVSEALSLARIRMKNLAVHKDEQTLISVLNLGMSDLYSRFNLRIASETVLTSHDVAVYELRNDDVNLLLTVYDFLGKELKSSDVIDDLMYDYKILNYREFLLRKPFDGYVYAVYKSSPVKLMDVNDEIDLPDAMINALLLYVGSMTEHTTNVWERGQVKMEASFYQQMYEKECQDLVNKGYLMSLHNERIAIQVKGYK